MISLADPVSLDRITPGDQSEIVNSETRPTISRTPTNGSLYPDISCVNRFGDWLSPVAAPGQFQKPTLS
jgi:hypothetical protein